MSEDKKPQQDPWEAEAAKMQQGPQQQAAPQDDWKVWTQGGDAQPEDSRNFVQKAFDNLTDVTPEQRQGHGTAFNAAQDFGAHAISAFGTPIIHPLQTAKGIAKLALDTTPAGALYNTAMGREDAPTKMAKSVISDFKEKGPIEGAAGVAGDVVGGAVGGELTPALRDAKNNVVERVRGYQSPLISPEMRQASRIAKAIGAPNVPQDLEGNIAKQLEPIKGYAAETGNPLHSQQELEQASRGLAGKGLDKFNTLMQPYQDDVLFHKGPVGIPEYEGEAGFTTETPGGKVNGGSAVTLKQLHDRITQINDLTRPAGNMKTQGATMTRLQQIGLEREGDILRQRLYDELSKRTGTDPGEIQKMREDYGQQFGIADSIDAARRARLGQSGMAAESSGSVPMSKIGMLEKVFTGIRGGREYLANARMRSALQPPPPVTSPSPFVRPAAYSLFFAPKQNQ